MKRLAAFVAVLALVFVGFTPAQAETYVPPNPSVAEDGETLFNIWELSSGNWDSRREANDETLGWTYDKIQSYLCDTEEILAKEAPCDPTAPNFSFFISNLLPVCQAPEEEFCIEALQFEVDGRRVPGKHIGYAGGQSFSAAPEIGLEPGSLISLWQVEGVNNSAGTDTYAVVVRSRQNYSKSAGRFVTTSLDFAVNPYQLDVGNYKPKESAERKDVNGLNKVFSNGSADPACIWLAEGSCGKVADFVGEPVLSLTMRVSTSLDGWFRGRVAETDVQIEAFSQGANRITVSGKPVAVPAFHVVANAENTPDSVKKLFPRGSGGSGNELFEGNSKKSAFSTDPSKAYTLLDGMRNLVKDTASGISTQWSMETIELGGNPCFRNQIGLIGAVSTNATAYDGTVPGFTNGQLTYKVAGLHYAPDGKTLNLGTYDLVIRGDVARCLYGFSSAPISANISVLSNDGESVVATTEVSETDGWIKLAAYGFTFSEKNIRVRLTQPQTKVLTKFTSAGANLTAKQKSEVKAVLKKAAGSKQITCVGNYVSAAAKASALAQAKAVCAYAKTQNKRFNYQASVKQTSNKKQAATVTIASK